MNEDERKRIEEEEVYRAAVRAKLDKGAKKPPARGCGSGCGTWIVGLVVVVVLIGVFAELGSGTSTSGRTPSPEPPRSAFDIQMAMPEVEKVSVTITSDPSGAIVSLGGADRGPTPLTVEIPANRPWPYELTVPASVANSDLYHRYTGTLTATEDTAISVWIERLTAEEIASRAAEEQARRDAEAERQRLAEEERERTLEKLYVYYRVESNCSRGVDITITNANGDSAQYSNQSNTFYYRFVPRSGQFLYLSAQNQCDSGYVTVRFVQDGVTIRENTSRGGFVIATISGRW